MREPVDGLGYEQARDELAEVVRKLESGGLSLDDAVALWERGEALARRCEEQLAGARERVQKVLDAPRGLPGGKPGVPLGHTGFALGGDGGATGRGRRW